MNTLTITNCKSQLTNQNAQLCRLHFEIQKLHGKNHAIYITLLLIERFRLVAINKLNERYKSGPAGDDVQHLATDNKVRSRQSVVRYFIHCLLFIRA